MKPFSRRIEKILAWIANVIMILVTGLLSLGAFSSQLETAFKQQEFEPILITRSWSSIIVKKLRRRHRIITCIIGESLCSSCDCSLSISDNCVIYYESENRIRNLIPTFSDSYRSNDSWDTTSCVLTILHRGSYVICEKTAKKYW